ncbi:MAG: universal stress protein [Phycisphaerae bacterium]
MIHMNRVLIPTDFSELARHALGYACDLARTYRAELHVLHVVSLAKEAPVAMEAGIGVGDGVASTALMESVVEDAARRARQLQAHVAEFSGELPIAPIAVVRNGVAWEQIARYADEAAIDLIVIGSHARGVMKRILLGSTSKAVLEHVARPVLMVPIASLQGGAVAANAENQVGAVP